MFMADRLHKKFRVGTFAGILFPKQKTHECTITEVVADLLNLGADFGFKIFPTFNRILEIKFRR